jgi:hypothetical protein
VLATNLQQLAQGADRDNLLINESSPDALLIATDQAFLKNHSESFI